MDREEYQRIQNLLAHERERWSQGIQYVAGLDEAGRGPLAGPVVAAAVIFSEGSFIPQIDDSKKLTSAIRESLYKAIVKEAVDYGVGLAQVDEIDKFNILQASYLAMKRSISNLRIQPDFLLIDGCAYPHDAIPYSVIIKGDSLSFSIAAASILAKVTRDRIMCAYHESFPQYGFDQHKGYATRSHLDAIEEYGFCEIHRQSFHPKRFLGQLDLFEHVCEEH